MKGMEMDLMTVVMMQIDGGRREKGWGIHGGVMLIEVTEVKSRNGRNK